MKKIISIIFVCFCLLSCRNSHSQLLSKIDSRLLNFDIEKEFNIDDFIIISDNANFSKYHFIDSIIPEQYYYYWECIFTDSEDTREVYVYNGDSLHYAEKTKKVKSYCGFFQECHPGICFNYIVAIDSTMNVMLVNRV